MVDWLTAAYLTGTVTVVSTEKNPSPAVPLVEREQDPTLTDTGDIRPTRGFLGPRRVTTSSPTQHRNYLQSQYLVLSGYIWTGLDYLGQNWAGLLPEGKYPRRSAGAGYHHYLVMPAY